MKKNELNYVAGFNCPKCGNASKVKVGNGLSEDEFGRDDVLLLCRCGGPITPKNLERLFEVVK